MKEFNEQVAECMWGPLDGEQWAIPIDSIMVVIQDGDDCKVKITKLLRCGDLPKKYRDDPNVLGWYNFVVEFTPFDDDDDTDGLNVDVRAFHAWYTKRDQISEIVKRQVRETSERVKKERKPGWMLTAEEIDDDYYGDEDPANDWKR